MKQVEIVLGVFTRNERKTGGLFDVQVRISHPGEPCRWFLFCTEHLETHEKQKEFAASLASYFKNAKVVVAEHLERYLAERGKKRDAERKATRQTKPGRQQTLAFREPVEQPETKKRNPARFLCEEDFAR